MKLLDNRGGSFVENVEASILGTKKKINSDTVLAEL